MNLSQIIERKKEEFLDLYWERGKYSERELGPKSYTDFIEKAIRESVEEALREVKPEGKFLNTVYFDNLSSYKTEYKDRVKEFMK